MPAWSLVNCRMAMLIYKLLCAVTASDVRHISELKRHKCIIAQRERNLYVSKLEPLNARPVRDIVESKEAIQYTNVAIRMGRPFFVTFLCPHLKVQGHAWACALELISSDIVFAP